MVFKQAALATLICALVPCMVTAQETDITDKISVELNASQTTDTSCTLTFLITNGLDTPVEGLTYETVLFDQQGQVNRLTLFSFGDLPPARPRVRQFAVPDVTCEDLSRIIFNGANTCEIAGEASDVCETGLMLSTRTKIEVLG